MRIRKQLNKLCGGNLYFHGSSMISLIISLFTMITSLCGTIFGTINTYSSLFNDNFNGITSNTRKNLIIISATVHVVLAVQD